jgi:hypothetical protein
VALFFLFLFSLQIIATYLVDRELLTSQSKNFVVDMTEHIANDLRYDNGRWDTTLYNSDPLTPYPNASTTFPVYIITDTGFVIERSKPVNGFLDTSDFKHLAEFTKPTTISTLTNENWRVLSKTIKNGDDNAGVLMVSYFNPEQEVLPTIDQRLQANIAVIESQVKVVNGELKMDKLDIRQIDYTISFEVVNKYNKVLANNGRTPSFIDPSYINSELTKPQVRFINDTADNEEFIINSRPFKDTKGNTVGLIVVGRSIEPVYSSLRDYLLASVSIGLILTIPLTIATIIMLNRQLRQLLNKRGVFEEEEELPKQIKFDKERSMIIVDGDEIKIPYDSNQYYIVKELFNKPTKKWDQDELLEKLGDDITMNNSRKVYDAVIAINKKVDSKLISYQDKLYFLNPDYISAIAS